MKSVIKMTLISLFLCCLLLSLLWDKALSERKAQPNLTTLIAYNAKLD